MCSGTPLPMKNTGRLELSARRMGEAWTFLARLPAHHRHRGAGDLWIARAPFAVPRRSDRAVRGVSTHVPRAAAVSADVNFTASPTAMHERSGTLTNDRCKSALTGVSKKPLLYARHEPTRKVV